MFLSPEELKNLTGYKHRTKQIRWLRAQGIHPFISATGDVSVTWDVVNEALRRASGMDARAATEAGPRPNLAVVQ